MTTPAQAPRTRTPSLDVTSSLTESALALLESAGPGALTVRGVAEHAGVAPMGVYSRFGSKDGLLEALFIHGFTMLAGQTAPDASLAPLDRLQAGCRAYRAFAVANPMLYRLMFDHMASFSESPAAHDAALRSFAVLASGVQSAMDAGALAPGDSTDVAQQLWSALHGAVSLELAGVTLSHESEGTYDAMLRAMLRGLSA